MTTPRHVWTPPIFGWQYELKWTAESNWYYRDEHLHIELGAWAPGGFRIVACGLELFEPGPNFRQAMKRGVPKFERLLRDETESLKRRQKELAATLKRLRP